MQLQSKQWMLKMRQSDCVWLLLPSGVFIFGTADSFPKSITVCRGLRRVDAGMDLSAIVLLSLVVNIQFFVVLFSSRRATRYACVAKSLLRSRD
jgi:hypothetical protein